jgi:hypothetical protein
MMDSYPSEFRRQSAACKSPWAQQMRQRTSIAQPGSKSIVLVFLTKGSDKDHGTKAGPHPGKAGKVNLERASRPNHSFCRPASSGENNLRATDSPTPLIIALPDIYSATNLRGNAILVTCGGSGIVRGIPGPFPARAIGVVVAGRRRMSRQPRFDAEAMP